MMHSMRSFVLMAGALTACGPGSASKSNPQSEVAEPSETSETSATAEDDHADRPVCFPENSLYLEDDRESLANGIDEATFNELIAKVAQVYEPIFRAFGARLIMNKLWDEAAVNAQAYQVGRDWYVDMFGGLARRPEITPDGFTLVICHELGHHLAGFPYKSGAGSSWASSEGQSDYFASQACGRLLWKDERTVNASFAAKVDATAKETCDRAWSSADDRNLCYRSAMAGLSTASLLSKTMGRGQPSFKTPDSSQVSVTYDGHPAGQCRLDTYFAGAICARNFPSREIPGRSVAEGRNSLAAERAASQVSCSTLNQDSWGRRPSCWFAARLTSDKPAPSPNPQPTPSPTPAPDAGAHEHVLVDESLFVTLGARAGANGGYTMFVSVDEAAEMSMCLGKRDECLNGKKDLIALAALPAFKGKKIFRTFEALPLGSDTTVTFFASDAQNAVTGYRTVAVLRK